jgi:hypothetical protein
MTINNPKLSIVVIVAILLAGIGANAQVGPEMRETKTADGLVIVSNVEGNYFRMQIKGKDVSRLHTTKKYWYTADGVRFQFFSEANVNFVMTDVPTLADGMVLKLYRSDFLRRFADENRKIRTSWPKLANNETALLLNYENHPAAPQPITEKQIYIVVATPMHVFGLFAPVPHGQTDAQVKQVLIRTLGTFKFGEEKASL